MDFPVNKGKLPSLITFSKLYFNYSTSNVHLDIYRRRMCKLMLKPCVCFSMVYLNSVKIEHRFQNTKLYIVRLECFGEDLSTCIKFIPYKGQ